jgi:diguanylate cyclase (GGDEF)-like protein/PAS domain S-box-containing protein
MDLDMPSISRLDPSETQSGPRTVLPEGTPFHRRRLLKVLFVHRDAVAVDSCVQELKKAQFTVSFDVVSNLAQCVAQLPSKSYDAVVVEYPSPICKGSQALQFFSQTGQRTSVIFLTTPTGSNSLAGLNLQGVFELVDRKHAYQLPMAVRRALNEKKLRIELGEAEKALRHSRSLYRALADNPAYGICRCDAQGKFLEVNKALSTMLGYGSTEELLAANRESAIVLNLGQGKPSGRNPSGSMQFEPIEVEWNRKNGTLLKARLSGRDAFDEHGNFNGCEVIAVDVTEQRKLEDQLRYQASSDSLTGLANHRHLFEVLQAEIGRSKRTGREFSLLLLDLDGLKNINDQFGHLTGDRALCRLAQIMTDCCRSIDTAARHGGDEFALLLPETSLADASLVGHRICEFLAREAEQPLLSVSVGIATYPADADTIGTLLSAADKALYAMKDRRTGPPALPPPRAKSASASLGFGSEAKTLQKGEQL